MELFNKVTAGRLALPEKVRVNLLALGDVGSTLLLGLRLMGGDVVSSIGICDVRENAALRWEFELNQIQPPSGAARRWRSSRRSSCLTGTCSCSAPPAWCRTPPSPAATCAWPSTA